MIEITISKDGMEEYRIESYGNRGNLWIENESGEGMEVTQADIYDMVNNYFKANL